MIPDVQEPPPSPHQKAIIGMGCYTTCMNHQLLPTICLVDVEGMELLRLQPNPRHVVE